VDVTSYLVSEIAAGKSVISMTLHNPSNSASAYGNVQSRERVDGYGPVLQVTTGDNNRPPSISLTPPSGNPFTAPANIPLTATASDSDGVVSKVDFYAGTSLIGTATTAPYSVTWPNVASGNYQLFAVATDNSGAMTASTSTNVTVNNGNVAPAVTLTTPLNGTTFPAGTSIGLAATASDFDGAVNKVEFFAGSTIIGTATVPVNGVYTAVWNNVTAGAYSLTARATDNTNGVTNSTPPAIINVVYETGLTPIADTYVRDGSSASTNFGTATDLQTQLSATAGSNRESYLKFNLATVAGITRAKLRLFGKLSDTTGTNVPLAVYSSAATSWVESGSGSITWNTKLTLNSPSLSQATITDNVARWYEFDVTSYVQQEKANSHDLVTLAVKGLANSSPFVTFNSKESTDSRPQLVLWTTQTRNALLVVGSTNLNTGDNAAKTRLQNLGFTVTAKVANNSLVTADADGKALIVVSSTSTANNVGNKFRYVPVPIVLWEFDVFDDMGMTGTTAADFGTTSTAQTALQIINATHPLAAGLSNQPTVSSPGTNFSWGNPNANAAKIATVVNDANKVVIFGYDKGVAMSSLNAPARRVGLFMTDVTAANFSTNGGLLFDAAIKWATEVITAPVIYTLTPSSGPAGTSVIIAGLNFGATQGISSLTFNGVSATASTWTDKSIAASVPFYSTSGPVVVTVSGVASNGLVFVVGDADVDGDGLADWWEIQYFGNLSQTANGDPDGDGITNLQEYQQGRNPTKSALPDANGAVDLKVYTPLASPTP
jgi:hypothetical protein